MEYILSIREFPIDDGRRIGKEIDNRGAQVAFVFDGDDAEAVETVTPFSGTNTAWTGWSAENNFVLSASNQYNDE